MIQKVSPSPLVLLVLYATLCSGCSKPPSARTTQESGPPELTAVESEEAQAALDAAAENPPAYFVKRPGEKTDDADKPATDAESMRARAKRSSRSPAKRSSRKPAKSTSATKSPTAKARSTSKAQDKTEKVAALEERTDYGQGLITSSLSAYRDATDQIEKIKIDRGLQLYSTKNGGPPQTHEEFMKEIIEKEKVNLPELPEGERYRFDPNEGPHGTLMIERLKRSKE